MDEEDEFDVDAAEDEININGFSAERTFFVTGSLSGVEDKQQLVQLKPVSYQSFNYPIVHNTRMSQKNIKFLHYGTGYGTVMVLVQLKGREKISLNAYTSAVFL